MLWGAVCFCGQETDYGNLHGKYYHSFVFTVIPIYELLKEMGLEQNLLGLILAEAGGGHVIFLMLFSSFYGGIPKELEEAATIDGSGFLKTYSSIMFPLSQTDYGSSSYHAVYMDLELFHFAVDCYAMSRPELRTLADWPVCPSRRKCGGLDRYCSWRM